MPVHVNTIHCNQKPCNASSIYNKSCTAGALRSLGKRQTQSSYTNWKYNETDSILLHCTRRMKIWLSIYCNNFYMVIKLYWQKKEKKKTLTVRVIWFSADTMAVFIIIIWTVKRNERQKFRKVFLKYIYVKYRVYMISHIQKCN